MGVLSKLLGSNKLNNPDKLSGDLLDAFAEFLKPVDEAEKGLAAAAAKYIVDDEGEELLLKLAGMDEPGMYLTLQGVRNDDKLIPYQKYFKMQEKAHKAQRKVMEHAGKAPHGVWIRYGKFLDAAGRKTRDKGFVPKGWPAWLAVLLGEATTAHYANYYENKNRKADLPDIALVEAMLEAEGHPADFVLRSSLTADDDQHTYGRVTTFMLGGYGPDPTELFCGWDKACKRYPDVVSQSLQQTDASSRIAAIERLVEMKHDFAEQLDILADLAVSSAKTVVSAVEPVVRKRKDALRPLLEQRLAEGNAAERNGAASFIWRVYQHDAAELLREHAKEEKSARVKQTIDKALAAEEAVAEATADPEPEIKLPPVDIKTGEIPLPDGVRERVQEAFNDAREYLRKQHEKAMERYEQMLKAHKEKKARGEQTWEPYKPRAAPEVKPKTVDKLLDYVEGKTAKFKEDHHIQVHARQAAKTVNPAMSRDGVELVHIIRYMRAAGDIQDRRTEIYVSDSAMIDRYRAGREEQIGLRELAAALDSIGTPPKDFARAWMRYNGSTWSWHNFFAWEADAVAPFFIEQTQAVVDALQKSGRDTYYVDDERRGAFKALGMMPKPPRVLLPALWEIALGEAKNDRPSAQAALRNEPNRLEKCLVALGDGKQEIRYAAAEWLGKIGDASAIEPLTKAFKKEKQERVKGAMMGALDALGADVDSFLSRSQLTKDAKKGMSKKVPAGAEWLPLDALPSLHWDDNGRVVPSEVVQWWLVSSVKQKKIEPGPLLKRYLEMCKADEATAFARFVLSAWIGRDTQPLPQEEAAKRAKQETDQMWQYDWYREQYKSKDHMYRDTLARLQNECVGSAIKEKGMLAIVAAAGDTDCAKQCEKYIRKWYGHRMAQCKALVEVLAWVGDATSIQILLSIANRFRTKGIREAAKQEVDALAEREGWTIDELADRTVPDGGFEIPADEDGNPIEGETARLILDYGPRKFTVTLDDDLKPVITNEDGKTVKNPPNPGKNDDAEVAKDAKKTFSTAKKTIKETVKRQHERFYESLCTQRTWTFGDWHRYLAQHPVVGRLCTRLVWAAFEPGQGDAEPTFITCFRPLEDGSLTNADDDAVELADDALVRVAHDCNTPADEAAKWPQHLDDYDVEPLFAQFGRAGYTLDDKQKKESDVTDYVGHMLTTFKLRSKATKLGYLRGEAEDGGCFMVYRKPFPSIGVQAVIEFTGSYVPEEDIPAALRELYFLPIKEGESEYVGWGGGQKLPLGDVPPVLLGECVNDVKQIAADGAGFDKDWESKAAF